MELNEQTLEQILTRQREEYQRYAGVLAESLRSDIKVIAEGHEVLREEMKAGFAAAKEETDALRKEMKFGFAEARTEMRLEISGVRMETEAIRLELEMIRSELSIIRHDLKEKVGRDELAVLEARVAKLEQAVRRSNS